MTCEGLRPNASSHAAVSSNSSPDSFVMDSGPRVIAQRHVLGMRIDGTSYAEATELIVRWAVAGESRYVCEAPVHMVMESYDAPDYRAVINHADLVTPGGMPLVWMLRALGLKGQTRVYGPELTLKVCQAASARGIPVGFYGGTSAAISMLSARLQEKFPGLRVTYAHSPPFRPLAEGEREGVIAQIRQSQCRILFVGLGCPKQERWMAAHRGVLPVVMLGVGAAFDFLSGQKPQAPAWMQRLGLEWLFRLCSEPKRLWFRYLYHNPRFVLLALGQLIREQVFSFRENHRAFPKPSETESSMEETGEFEKALAQKQIQVRFKRLFDLIASIVALILLAPLLLVIALLITVTSPGPVFFRQKRDGYQGRDFLMWKFRSMQVRHDHAMVTAQQTAAAEGKLIKLQRDPRVTRLGKILRVTSLDELPQLFNVLKGEMSLIGPRPLVPFMLEPYPDFRRTRALMRPGITGLWQIRDRENNTSALSMMKHDLEYIERFSLALDGKILLRTVGVVFSRKGAC